jgi:hypothetical protein
VDLRRDELGFVEDEAIVGICWNIVQRNDERLLWPNKRELMRKTDW